MAITLADVAHRLRELIGALDRRVARTEHATEAVIARESAVLRERAVNRLAEIADQAVALPDDPRRVG